MTGMSLSLVFKFKYLHLIKLIGFRGAGLCSRLANYRADRFAAFAFFALGYFPPAPDFDVAAINAQSLVKNGYENFGYWNFFAKDEAAKVIEEHVSELDIVGCNRVRTDNC